jgi:hypothetical protein
MRERYGLGLYHHGQAQALEDNLRQVRLVARLSAEALDVTEAAHREARRHRDAAG